MRAPTQGVQAPNEREDLGARPTEPAESLRGCDLNIRAASISCRESTPASI